MTTEIKVLDHGYVKLIECFGTGLAGTGDCFCCDSGAQPDDYEVGIIEAARQSTQGSFRGWDKLPCDCAPPEVANPESGGYMHDVACSSVKNPGDRRLLSYLLNNNHATPFEFSGMILEVQAPIFVFREWQRHRIPHSYNEMSARYAPLPDLSYVPTVERLMRDAGRNKQAGPAEGAEYEMSEERAEVFRRILNRNYEQAELDYSDALNHSIPKELARCLLSVGRYSKMRVASNLRGWMHFLQLRVDPRAQWEIQQYARAVGQLVQENFPQTFTLLPPTIQLLIREGI